jgi:CRP-like cAMP-binding protein
MSGPSGEPAPASRPSLAENRLLAALPRDERERLLPSTDVVELATDQGLHEAGDSIDWVYFPIDAVVALASRLADGHIIEVCMVGCDGMVGLQAALGTDSFPFRAAVQVPGRARRMAARVVREEAARGGAFKQVLDRYAQALLIQAAQSAACNRLHPIDQRCARWLLMTRDRTQTDRFPLTHESLALKLGARRPTVTTAARLLQQAGFIRYRRGQMTILDRAGLEGAACECYRIVRAEDQRLLG